MGNIQKKIQRYEERLAETQKEYDAEPENTLKKRTLSTGVHSWEQNVNLVKQRLIELTRKKDVFDKLDLFEIGVGKDSHRKGYKDFKNGAPKNLISKSGWKIDQPRDFLNVKDSGYRVLEPEFDNILKGKTIIDSNIPTKADPKVLKLQEEVKYVWNNILSDQERDTVDILRIKYTDEPKYKGRGSKKIRTLGTHGGRSVLDSDTEGEKMIMYPSVLTVHLAYKDKRNDVLNTVAHELAHARWATEVEPNKEKMTKFTDNVVKMGKEKALTEYAGSYFDDLETVKEEAKKKWEDEKDRLINHHNYGKAEHQTEKEYKDWLNQNILEDVVNRKKQAEKDNSENIKKAEQLIANETHSEYFGMVSSPTEGSYHNVKTERLKAMSKMIKEDLYD